MSIFEIMEEEHEKILELMEQLERAPEGCGSGQRSELFGQLREELQAHLRTEEDVLYCALWSDPAVKGCVGDSEQEHHAVDLLLEELEGQPMRGKQWETKLRVLKEILEEHFRYEEEVVFASAERHFSENRDARAGEFFGGSRESVQLSVD